MLNYKLFDKSAKMLQVDVLSRLTGQKVFLSTSGGRTSMYQAEKELEAGLHLNNDVIVLFANTGWEHPKTLDFVNNNFKRWEKVYGVKCIWVEAVVHHGQKVSCSHKVVTYETASRGGEPFEDAIRKYGIPNNGFNWCTRELKENPIKSYLTKVKGWKKGEYYTILGMRSDEIQRVVGDVVVSFGRKHSMGTEKLLSLRKVIKGYAATDHIQKELYDKCFSLKGKVTNKRFKEEYTKLMTRFIHKLLQKTLGKKLHYKDTAAYVKRTLTLEDTQNKIYPLVDWHPDMPDKIDILDWWEDRDFDLDLEEWEGNCYGCYKKSTKKLLKAIRDDQELFYNTWELNYGHIGPNKINGKLVDEPRTMYRQGHTNQSMIALFRQTPLSYLKDTGEEEYTESGCASQCEAFGGDD